MPADLNGMLLYRSSQIVDTLVTFDEGEKTAIMIQTRKRQSPANRQFCVLRGNQIADHNFQQNILPDAANSDKKST